MYVVLNYNGYLVTQLRLVARDQGSPRQSGQATVTVRVERNQYAPVFVSGSYSVTIAETHTPSLPIITIEAKDNDPRVGFSRDPDVSELFSGV